MTAIKKHINVDDTLFVDERMLDSAAIKTVPISQIDFDNTELCFRLSLDLGNLIEDIQKRGQQFPVVLRSAEKDGKYQIVCGFRRCNCLLEIGAPSVAAVIRNDLTDDEAYYLSFIENERRKNLTGLDKAFAISKLAAKGKTPSEIQAVYCIGERQYFRLKKASTFPKEIQDAIADRFIQMTHALVLCETYETVGPQLDLDEWIDWIVENKASVKALGKALKARYFPASLLEKSLLRTHGGGFRLASIRFSPTNVDVDSARRIRETLSQALVAVEDWLRSQA